MQKHGYGTILILSAAVLCLFLSGGSAGSGIPAANSNSSTMNDTTAKAAADASVEASYDTCIRPEHKTTSVSAVPLLRCIHYTEKAFLKSVNEALERFEPSTAQKDSANGSGTVLGGIVPHHLLAAGMIAGFFETLAQDPPETVIVIGPNHKLTGISELHTSSADWGTSFGISEADTELIDKIIKAADTAENNTLMEDEHSISSLVPYIKYYLPDTKIVPLLIHGSYSAERSKKLGKLLADIISEKPGIIVIASIDFSHYLDVAKADESDAATLDAIKSWNLEALRMMGNDNLDSVPSIMTLLTAMQAEKATEIEVTGHNNSSRITGGGYEYTTSYFTMFFRRDGQVDALP